jgi:hypothetical protein
MHSCTTTKPESTFDKIYKKLVESHLSGPDILRILDTIIFIPIREQITVMQTYYSTTIYKEIKRIIKKIKRTDDFENMTLTLKWNYSNWYEYLHRHFKNVLKNATITPEDFDIVLDLIPTNDFFMICGIKIFTDKITRDIKDIEDFLNGRMNELTSFSNYEEPCDYTNVINYIIPRKKFYDEWLKYSNIPTLRVIG